MKTEAKGWLLAEPGHGRHGNRVAEVAQAQTVVPAIRVAQEGFAAEENYPVHIGGTAQQLDLPGQLGAVAPCCIAAGPVNSQPDVAMLAVGMAAPPVDECFKRRRLVAELPKELGRY